MKSHFLNYLLLTFILVVLLSPQSVMSQSAHGETELILKRYAEDYENDVTLKKDITFAVKVDQNFWHIVATAKTDSTAAKVEVIEGKPSKPAFYFFTDFQTLQKVDKGELNALTASAKAFSSDKAPFDVDIMEGYQPGEDFMSTLFSVYFHFWTRDSPEIIPYGIDLTRFTHGAQASIFYYQPGFRSAYVAIKKGQHANKNEKSKTNPFPTLLIAINGEGIGIIDGKTITLGEGEAMLIPAGVSHEFLNPDNDEPLECILLMFGEGA